MERGRIQSFQSHLPPDPMCPFLTSGTLSWAKAVASKVEAFPGRVPFHSAEFHWVPGTRCLQLLAPKAEDLSRVQWSQAFGSPSIPYPITAHTSPLRKSCMVLSVFWLLS